MQFHVYNAPHAQHIFFSARPHYVPMFDVRVWVCVSITEVPRPDSIAAVVVDVVVDVVVAVCIDISRLAILYALCRPGR